MALLSAVVVALSLIVCLTIYGVGACQRARRIRRETTIVAAEPLHFELPIPPSASAAVSAAAQAELRSTRTQGDANVLLARIFKPTQVTVTRRLPAGYTTVTQPLRTGHTPVTRPLHARYTPVTPATVVCKPTQVTALGINLCADPEDPDVTVISSLVPESIAELSGAPRSSSVCTRPERLLVLLHDGCTDDARLSYDCDTPVTQRFHGGSTDVSLFHGGSTAVSLSFHGGSTAVSFRRRGPHLRLVTVSNGRQG